MIMCFATFVKASRTSGRQTALDAELLRSIQPCSPALYHEIYEFYQSTSNAKEMPILTVPWQCQSGAAVTSTPEQQRCEADCWLSRPVQVNDSRISIYPVYNVNNCYFPPDMLRTRPPRRLCCHACFDVAKSSLLTWLT